MNIIMRVVMIAINFSINIVIWKYYTHNFSEHSL